MFKDGASFEGYTFQNVDDLDAIGNDLFEENSSTDKKSKKLPSYKDSKKEDYSCIAL